MTPEFFAVYPAVTHHYRTPGKQIANEALGRAVVREVAASCKVDSSHIMGPFRDMDSVKARRRVIKALFHEHGWGISAIGRFIDRDHSTVNYALGKRRVRPGPRYAPPPVPILDR